MEGMSGTCPECQAELAPGARFCPRCGGFAGMAGPVPGGQPTVTQPAVTQQAAAQQTAAQPPQWPGGPDRTVTVAQGPASAWPGGAARPPRAALPAAPAAAPTRAEPPPDALRADWNGPTVPRQPGYQQPAQPFQQPAPPTRADPALYQAPLPQGGPPPGYPQDSYAPTGNPQGGYPQDGHAQDGYAREAWTPHGYPQDSYAPGGYPQDSYPPGSYPRDNYAPGGYRRDGYPHDGYAQGGYPQDGYAPTEYAQGGYPPGGRPSPPAGGPEVFEPPRYEGPQQGGPPGAPRQPPRRHDRDRGRRGVPLVVWIVLLVLLAGGAGAVLKLMHPFSHTSGQGTTGTASGSSAGASGSASGHATPSGGTASAGKSSATGSAATEQQAAAGMAALLSQSAADRTATGPAASDIASCGPNLKTDPAVFAKAVSSRQALLAKLAALPGSSTLPPALVTDLTNALQASIAADQAYTKWANDELAKQCVPNDTADPGYQATVAPDEQATTAKTDFAAAWNPVAAKYGLTTYQPGQL